MTEPHTEASTTFPFIPTPTTTSTSATHETSVHGVTERLASHFSRNERTSSSATFPLPLSSNSFPQHRGSLPFSSSVLKPSASYPTVSERKTFSVAKNCSSRKAIRTQEDRKPSAFPLTSPPPLVPLRQTKSTSHVPTPKGVGFCRLSTTVATSSPAFRHQPEEKKSVARVSESRGSNLHSSVNNNVAHPYDSTQMTSMGTQNKVRETPPRHSFCSCPPPSPSKYSHGSAQMKNASSSVLTGSIGRESCSSACTFSEQENGHLYRSISSCSADKDAGEEEGSTALLVVAGNPRPSHFTALHAARQAYQQLTADHTMLWDRIVEQQQRQKKIKSILRYSLQPAVFQVRAEWKLMKSSAMYAFEAYRGYFFTYHDLLRQLMVQLLEEEDEEDRGVVAGKGGKMNEFEELDLRRKETYSDRHAGFRCRQRNLSSQTNRKFPTWDLLSARPSEEKSALQPPKSADGVIDNRSSSRAGGSAKRGSNEEEREKRTVSRSGSKGEKNERKSFSLTPAIFPLTSNCSIDAPTTPRDDGSLDVKDIKKKGSKDFSLEFERREGSRELRHSASTNSLLISSSSFASTVTAITPPTSSSVLPSTDDVFSQISCCKNVDCVTPEKKEETSRKSTTSSLPSVSSARSASADSFPLKNAAREEMKTCTPPLNEVQEKNENEKVVVVKPSPEEFLLVPSFKLRALQDQLAEAHRELVKLSQKQEKEKQFFQISVNQLHRMYALREQRMREDMLLFREENRQNEGEVHFCGNDEGDRAQKKSDHAVGSLEIDLNIGRSRTETNGKKKVSDGECGKEVKQSKESATRRMPDSEAFSFPLDSSSSPSPSWLERDTLWKQAVEETVRQEKGILTSTRSCTPVRGSRSASAKKSEVHLCDSNSIGNRTVLPLPDYYSIRCQKFFTHAAERLAGKLRLAEKENLFSKEGKQNLEEDHHQTTFKNHSCAAGTRDFFLHLPRQNHFEIPSLKTVETEKAGSCTTTNAKILSTDFPHNEQVNRVIAQGMWAEQLLLERSLRRTKAS